MKLWWHFLEKLEVNRLISGERVIEDAGMSRELFLFYILWVLLRIFK